MDAAAQIWRAHPQSTEAIAATLVMVFVSKLSTDVSIDISVEEEQILTPHDPAQDSAPPGRGVLICPIIQSS